MEREFYRIPEFCQRYAISRTSLYREIWAERLRVIKRGRRTLIDRAEAERWAANHLHKAQSAGAITEPA